MTKRFYCKDNRKIIRSKSESAWQFLIDQAKAQVVLHEALAARLNGAIEHFEKCKSRGDEFPGEKKLREVGLIS